MGFGEKRQERNRAKSKLGGTPGKKVGAKFFYLQKKRERRRSMTFEEYWKEVENTGILARVAIRLLPNSFSNELKDMLVEMDPEDVATKCQRAINEINRGSVVSLETLIRRQL